MAPFAAIAEFQGGSFSLTRSRTAETLQNFRVFLSVSQDVNDLTHGEASVARFESPEGKAVLVAGVPGRDSTISFYKSIHCESIASAIGTWKFTIIDGTQLHENLRITIPPLTEADFPTSARSRPLPTKETHRKCFFPM
jgi:hypothetical protein